MKITHNRHSCVQISSVKDQPFRKIAWRKMDEPSQATFTAATTLPRGLLLYVYGLRLGLGITAMVEAVSSVIIVVLTRTRRFTDYSARLGIKRECLLV